jgi:hypothetical protein
MAKGKKTGGKNFEVGDNRLRRPRKDPDFKALAQWTKTEIEAKMHTMLQLKLSDVEAIVDKKENKVLDHWLGQIVLMGVKGGDIQRLNFMFEQIYGKLPERKNLDVTSTHALLLAEIEQL